jgi:hypothetical protein
MQQDGRAPHPQGGALLWCPSSAPILFEPGDRLGAHHMLDREGLRLQVNQGLSSEGRTRTSAC